MQWLQDVVVVILIIIFIVGILVTNKDQGNMKINGSKRLPYKLKDDFLTDTERSFYHSLKQCVGDNAVICPKVGLKDIFFIGKGIGQDYMKFLGKIAQKHVDFLLCDPSTMKPLCGIELDDLSHTNKKTHEQDLFVEKVYQDANLELIRISSKYTIADIETALMGVFDSPKRSL